MIEKIKNSAMHYWHDHKVVVIVVAVIIAAALILQVLCREIVMDYRFTAILIILLCLLAIFVRPNNPTLKIDGKDYILPKPKPKLNE